MSLLHAVVGAWSDPVDALRFNAANVRCRYRSPDTALSDGSDRPQLIERQKDQNPVSEQPNHPKRRQRKFAERRSPTSPNVVEVDQAVDETSKSRSLPVAVQRPRHPSASIEKFDPDNHLRARDDKTRRHETKPRSSRRSGRPGNRQTGPGAVNRCLANAFVARPSRTRWLSSEFSCSGVTTSIWPACSRKDRVLNGGTEGTGTQRAAKSETSF